MGLKNVVVYHEDKCWFGVESKSFEDLIEETKRKVIGKICERVQTFRHWKGLRPAVLSKMGSFLESLGWSGQAKKPCCFYDPKESGGAQSYLFKGLVLRGVFHSRVKWFNGKSLLLKWWNPSMGCLMEARDVREVWVRVLGLVLHLWGNWNSQWARILASIKGKLPSSFR
ncbi:hypothetical protein AAG906_019678 [Vitis piasezkii]